MKNFNPQEKLPIIRKRVCNAMKHITSAKNELTKIKEELNWGENLLELKEVHSLEIDIQFELYKINKIIWDDFQNEIWKIANQQQQ